MVQMFFTYRLSNSEIGYNMHPTHLACRRHCIQNHICEYDFSNKLTAIFIIRVISVCLCDVLET